MKESMFYDVYDDKVQCNTCNHRCRISINKRGICGVRENIDGRLYVLNYGLASSVNVDPIEKKPLYHFHPGSRVLSLGTVGCNFRCLHCQNYSISTAKIEDYPLKQLLPEDIVSLAKMYNTDGISWTYNEPTIWYEFTYDTSKVAKKDGFTISYVTNGYITEDALKEISPYLDAANVDVKAFRDDFYRKVCHAKLEPVLTTCRLVKELGIHLEITYLLIPTYNDDEEEIRDFCRWVAELDPSIPVHFTAFYPEYKMLDLPPTPIETLNKAYTIGTDEGIEYIYLGNIPGSDRENTYCPNCGTLLIKRNGFFILDNKIRDKKCPKCNFDINLII